MRKDSSLVNFIADDGIRPASYDPLQSFLFSVDGPFSSIFFYFLRMTSIQNYFGSNT